MIFLNKISASPLCSRILALSLRNLSISSTATTSSPTINNSIIFSDLKSEALVPLIARANTSVINNVGITGPLWRRKEIMDLPLTNKIIENPTKIVKIIEEITKIERTIEAPRTSNSVEKQAKNNMIMIRRAKMRKHKLRKLRKKMKFLWAKVRQRREWRKEKAFQAELVAKVKEAESFSAEKFVAEKLRLATETPIPRFWKHRRYPQFLIIQKMENEQRINERKKLRLWDKYLENDKQEESTK